ncbi:MAG: DM13 domain-containing protein, partial [Patescibacteria group bacterium]|nr:DM13 domain-containing protein [Patescibacteria group bacterium]
KMEERKRTTANAKIIRKPNEALKNSPSSARKKKLLFKIIISLIVLIAIIIGMFFLIKSIKKSSGPEEKRPLNKENSVQTEPGKVIDTYLLDETAPNSSEVIVQGRFNSVEQNVEGKALFIESNGERFLRFEEFESINGQDVHVYLSPILNLDESDVVDLGLLRSVSGNFNYPLDKNIDLAKYNNVLIWSNPFDAFFGYASLLNKELPPKTEIEMTDEEKAQQDAENNPQMPPPLPDELTPQETANDEETNPDQNAPATETPTDTTTAPLQ